jgi:hypothetical protein
MRHALLALALVVLPALAHADMIPPPRRPEWNDPPAPLPLPPEVFVASMAVAACVAWGYRRRRASVPA